MGLTWNSGSRARLRCNQVRAAQTSPHGALQGGSAAAAIPKPTMCCRGIRAAQTPLHRAPQGPRCCDPQADYICAAARSVLHRRACPRTPMGLRWPAHPQRLCCTDVSRPMPASLPSTTSRSPILSVLHGQTVVRLLSVTERLITQPGDICVTQIMWAYRCKSVCHGPFSPASRSNLYGASDFRTNISRPGQLDWEIRVANGDFKMMPFSACLACTPPRGVFCRVPHILKRIRRLMPKCGCALRQGSTLPFASRQDPTAVPSRRAQRVLCCRGLTRHAHGCSQRVRQGGERAGGAKQGASRGRRHRW